MSREKLIEGRDYYMDGSKWVFTSYFHLKRGYCCKSGCRHCPYGESMKIAPGQYIWKSKNSDLPVTVIESIGTAPDGRLYVRVVGSDTAIPADELIKAKDEVSRRPEPKRLFWHDVGDSYDNFNDFNDDNVILCLHNVDEHESYFDSLRGFMYYKMFSSGSKLLLFVFAVFFLGALTGATIMWAFR